jgi:predicted GNAT superfamily acetyltransferase
VKETEAAWRLARDVAERAGVELAPVSGMEDARRAAGVVADVWGEDLLDPSLLWALRHAGNVAILARRGSEAVGFVMGFVGLEEGLHLHSHILGVLPADQSKGVGFALKLAQRAACLDEGIEEVRWTFDPLVARNARFNLVKLGTVATRLLPSFYGEMRDAVNRGDRSDRFEVRWRLSSKRVERALLGSVATPPGGPLLLATEGPPDAPTPVVSRETPVPGSRVAVPTDYHGLRARDPELARSWREASAAVFAECFDGGLVCTWISVDGVYAFEGSADWS